MNRLKVAWIYPSIVFGAYWKPVIERFRQIYPNSVFFTGCVWPGFDSKDPACAAFEIVGQTRYVAAKEVGSGYKRAFIMASPAVLGPLTKFAPRVVFSSAFSVWTILALLVKPFTRWRVSIMYDGSSPNSDFRDSAFRTGMRKIMAHFTDAFVANSDAAKSYMMDVLAVPESKIFRETYLVPDVSELNVECSEENRQKIELLSVGLEGPVFLFVGQLIERKGIRTLLEAVRRVKEAGHQKFTILIIGDGEKRLEFEALAREFGVDSQIRWMGWIQYRQLGAFFRISDVFVFPTFEDCWGMAVSEAMTFGKPVLCSTGANSCELVHEGRNGFQFDPNDVDALAAGMTKFILAPELAATMGEQSREIIRAYTPESAAQGFAKVVAALTEAPAQESIGSLITRSLDAGKRALLTRCLRLKTEAGLPTPVAGQEPCIMVPSHSPVLDAHAETSFRRCLEVFAKRDILLVVPEGMDTSAYHRIGSNFTEVRVPVEWQSSLKAYNKMKCSSEFYKKFEGYSHMLTYELDAYAFRDELDLWCAKPYDYIGAPWFASFSEATPKSPMTAVGNSGFSLRRISSCLLVTRFWEQALEALDQPGLRLVAKWPIDDLNNLQTAAEDVFWSRHAKVAYPQFSVSPLEEARKFSFEVNPGVLYEMNGRELPFGCHKWFAYDPGFWAPFIGSTEPS